MHGLPLAGRAADLGGNRFDIFYLRYHGCQLACLSQFYQSAVLEQERQNAQPGACGDAHHQQPPCPSSYWQRAVGTNEIGCAQQQNISHEKRPFSQLKFHRIAHSHRCRASDGEGQARGGYLSRSFQNRNSV